MMLESHADETRESPGTSPGRGRSARRVGNPDRPVQLCRAGGPTWRFAGALAALAALARGKRGRVEAVVFLEDDPNPMGGLDLVMVVMGHGGAGGAGWRGGDMSGRACCRGLHAGGRRQAAPGGAVSHRVMPGCARLWRSRAHSPVLSREGPGGASARHAAATTPRRRLWFPPSVALNLSSLAGWAKGPDLARAVASRRRESKYSAPGPVGRFCSHRLRPTKLRHLICSRPCHYALLGVLAASRYWHVRPSPRPAATQSVRLGRPGT